MLPRNWRIVVENRTTVTSGAVSVRVRRKKIASDLSITYDAEATVFSAASITNGTFDTAGSTAQDNSGGAASWQSMDWIISVANGTAAGDYAVWLQASTDGGTTWPTNGESELLDVINVAASTTELRSGSY